MDVLVSICCITFNHAPFIRECLDGFLMQKCNFDYEILIHDDASTDGTQDIIKEYQEKYPGIIKPILQKENQYSKGLPGRMNASFNFPRARGKYIALCEGDDCWIDRLKLQKQIMLMEENPNFSVSFHPSGAITNNDPESFIIKKPEKIPSDSKFSVVDIIQRGGGIMSTNSMIFLSKHIGETPQWMKKSPVGDLPLMLLLGTKGEIGYLDEPMSLYRNMSSQYSWSYRIQKWENQKNYYIKVNEMWAAFDIWTHEKYHKHVRKKIRSNKINCVKSFLKHCMHKTTSFIKT